MSMKANYSNGRLNIDAGNKMDIDEIGEFVHFMFSLINTSNVEVRQNVEDGNQTNIILDLDKYQADLLASKLQLEMC